MRVLIACEESQTECMAFRALGHEAYSCLCRKYADNKFDYCPNCGAKMDGGGGT